MQLCKILYGICQDFLSNTPPPLSPLLLKECIYSQTMTRFMVLKELVIATHEAVEGSSYWNLNWFGHPSHWQTRPELLTVQR